MNNCDLKKNLSCLSFVRIFVSHWEMFPLKNVHRPSNSGFVLGEEIWGFFVCFWKLFSDADSWWASCLSILAFWVKMAWEYCEKVFLGYGLCIPLQTSPIGRGSSVFICNLGWLVTYCVTPVALEWPVCLRLPAAGITGVSHFAGLVFSCSFDFQSRFDPALTRRSLILKL